VGHETQTAIDTIDAVGQAAAQFHRLRLAAAPGQVMVIIGQSRTGVPACKSASFLSAHAVGHGHQASAAIPTETGGRRQGGIFIGMTPAADMALKGHPQRRRQDARPR